MPTVSIHEQIPPKMIRTVRCLTYRDFRKATTKAPIFRRIRIKFDRKSSDPQEPWKLVSGTAETVPTRNSFRPLPTSM